MALAALGGGRVLPVESHRLEISDVLQLFRCFNLELLLTMFLPAARYSRLRSTYLEISNYFRYRPVNLGAGFRYNVSPVRSFHARSSLREHPHVHPARRPFLEEYKKAGTLANGLIHSLEVS